MYAVIEVGAKQYSVTKDDIIEVERQAFEQGKDLNFDQVLLVSFGDGDVRIGQPYVKDASVKTSVLGEFRAKKVISFKYRRRKSSHWKKGHRQNLLRLKIKEIICS